MLSRFLLTSKLFLKIEDNKKDCGIFLRNPFYYQLFNNELYVFADHFVEYRRQ